MAKISNVALVCALAAIAAVAAPGFAPERRGIDSLLPIAAANGNIPGVTMTVIPSREDLEKLKIINEQVVSALLAGKMDAYYSYAGDAALIVDKYMDDSQVATLASQIIHLLKFPTFNPELDRVNESYLARLENPAVQQNYASVMQIVNELASYQADYAKSAYGIDINSMLAQAVSLAYDANKHGDGEDVQAPASPTSTVKTASSSVSTSKSSSTSATPNSSNASSSSTSSDTKSNDAGSSGVASLGMLPLGVAISALVAFF
ncbi:hypothetical protein GGF42_000959 [Coemansia sp. RSA 2424]|nr:hypothetical protein GGF42_000959 [Coemansia sp. RSA 2424]